MENKDLSEIKNSLNRGIDFLKRSQLHNGEFISYFSNDEKLKNWATPDYVILPSALIGNSLIQLKDHKEVEKILHGIADFLEGQMQNGGIWNFFNKHHYLYTVPPNDIDDTVVAATVLKLMQRAYPNNIDTLLANRNSKGLFYTWFVLRPKLIKNRIYWLTCMRTLRNPIKSYLFKLRHHYSNNDIDAVVNSNVLFFLGSDKASEPILDYLISIIKEKREHKCDKWYHNIFIIYYFISRNYSQHNEKLNVIRELIISRILTYQNKDNSFGKSSLDTALAVCTLINFKSNKKDLNPSIVSIIHNQQCDGSWERGAFFYTGFKKEYCWGSEALTTTYAIEAIYRFSSIE